MNNSCPCTTKSSREPPSSNNMFRRILKKFKGSHPGEEEEEDLATADAGLESAAPTKEDVNNTSGSTHSESQGDHDDDDDDDDGDDDDDDDDDSSSAGSDSSSEAYFSLDEMIIVPTRKNNGQPASPTAAPPPAVAAAVPTSPPHFAPPRFDLQLLARTHFPDFGVPDGELTDSSDDESLVQQKEERYRTKEDQDVAVFMDLTKRMSMKSLLHLLQGHVRSTDPSQEYLQQYNKALSESEGRKSRSSSETAQSDMRKKPLPRQKKFRWAEVTSEKVRVVIYEIESIKEEKSLWWTPEEMQSIRSELIDVVKFFRKRRPNYIMSVETIARHQAQESVIEDHMKKLTEDSFARGLEGHVVRMLSDHRKSTIQAVLEEQKECRVCNDNSETTSHCLREQSVAYSKMSSRFAVNMAKCDEIDALKANMSRWRASPPSATNGFFDA